MSKATKVLLGDILEILGVVSFRRKAFGSATVFQAFGWAQCHPIERVARNDRKGSFRMTQRLKLAP